MSSSTADKEHYNLTLEDMDPAVIQSDFCQTQAPKSLHITCYGSSSNLTPTSYIQEARSLGYTLAKRGHVCINGAGPHGCMAAMNDGAVLGNGHIVGIIHEMFLVDSGYFLGPNEKANFDDIGTHKAFQSKNKETGLIREIIVAGGDDLQERKKLLVENADALVVLPGGPGTWDELWEMACARHLGLVDLPIVCINVDNYYEPFQKMLDRAHKDKLIKLPPAQIVHFAANVKEAVEWCEAEAAKNAAKRASHNPKVLPRRSSEWRKSSFFSSPVGARRKGAIGMDLMQSGLFVLGGMALGIGIGMSLAKA
ncbi:unnamed protein product [Cylindrotheca closterium]|uniref:Cytokinin riboside 5'-monophosphate phosphoribohydrolase n=1 Tax=Cylindrotheca closterium TaxID=2856 RepID=A0AAD2FNC9_9STRA|nr:unnamed protein product [Cylindrotheca closterium]